jgi:hypothetical protein
MSLKDMLWHIPGQYRKWTNIEGKILETLIEMKSGNAYAIWKASGLKHYPTVLRILKKLHEMRLIQLLGQKGSRDETIYVSTLAATLMLYIIKEDRKSLHRVVADNSDLFRELEAVKKDYQFFVAREIIEDTVIGKKQREVNQIVRDGVEDDIQELIMNITHEDEAQKIMRLGRVKWVRDLIITVAQDEIAYDERHMNKLKELLTRLQ